MRITFSVILFLVALALLFFAEKARTVNKPIKKVIRWLLLALIPPIIGNMMINLSGSESIAAAGYYIYMIGMDFLIFPLLSFTFEYCSFSRPNEGLRYFGLSLLGIDMIQLALNPIWHHVFDLEPILFEGYDLYQKIPHWGYYFHHIVVFGIFTGVLILFLVKWKRSSEIYAERYGVIFFALALNGILQIHSLFMKTPVQWSTLGFGICGLLINYFSLYYRPTRLIDQMLALIASEMPAALYFFDSNSQCIWANKKGLDIVGSDDKNFEKFTDRLSRIFGSLDQDKENWSSQFISGSGDDVKSYVLEKRTFRDDDENIIGSYLSVRDNSDDRRVLQNEMYKATHDSLTHVYNRAGYDLLLSGTDMKTTFLFLIDADHFGEINDAYGNEIGDRIIIKIADSLRDAFRADDYICRIGGDEFVILMRFVKEYDPKMVGNKIERINQKLADSSDGLPKTTVSAGIAFGGLEENKQKWFRHAEQALYESKTNGRNQFTIYEPGNIID